MYSSFDLTVPVPAEEWNYCQRRLKYLEALLLRVVRDKDNIQEWFTPAELAWKFLPGVPTTTEGIARKASKEGWKKRKAKFKGTWFNAYHVTSLPARAFDALISAILNLPEIDAIVPMLPDLPEPEPPPAAEPSNAAPPWVLPLMRIMKLETDGNLSQAWQKLPERLPPGVMLPSVDEAAAILIHFGLAGGDRG